MKSNIVFEAKTKKYHLRYWESLTWAAKINRKNETEGEKILWNKLLRRKYLGYKFTRQKPIGRFIADFYCSELNLIIEVDGDSHDFKKDRDLARDKYLKSCGITTVRLKNEDILNSIDKVKEKIESCLKPLPC